jgi:hypothetical protein
MFCFIENESLMTIRISMVSVTSVYLALILITALDAISALVMPIQGIALLLFMNT